MENFLIERICSTWKTNNVFKVCVRKFLNRIFEIFLFVFGLVLVNVRFYRPDSG